MRWFCFLVLLFFPLTAGAQEPEPKALIQKSIAAQGGEKEVAQLQVAVKQLKGTIHTPDGDIAFSGEVAFEKTARQRITLDIEVAGQKINLITAITADGSWMKVNDTVLDLDADKVAEAREQAHAAWAATLVPLLANDFKLAGRGEVKVGDRPAWGVIVSRAGHRDMTLYFDKETSLLVKIEQRIKDDSGVEVTQESVFSDFEEKGLRQARKSTATRNDKPYLEAEITGYQLKDKLDDSLFKRP
jgi:hypothetical protein